MQPWRRPQRRLPRPDLRVPALMLGGQAQPTAHSRPGAASQAQPASPHMVQCMRMAVRAAAHCTGPTALAANAKLQVLQNADEAGLRTSLVPADFSSW